MAEQSPIYPLKFEPIYKPKVWGGRSLARLGKTLPGGEDHGIGEAWELADLGSTSASGGGGGAERSVIVNGPLAGQTFHAAIDGYCADMLGDLPLNEQDAFPLLVKFLDAQENLSVQVHPSPEYAADHPEASIKHEAWYIVDAAPGAAIYKGVREGTTPSEFRAALEAGELEPLLVRHPVEPGQCHYLPSGTCHALGAGVVVAEVQTPSDTTYRVYDWGRSGRELHIEEAMQCIHFGPPGVAEYEVNAELRQDSVEATRLVQCPYFRIDRYRAPGGFEDELREGQPAVWIVLDGSGQIISSGATTEFAMGETLFLPAGLRHGHVQLSEAATWLEVTFPQAEPGTLA